MVRAPDCGSGCRGFESHLPPHKSRGSGCFPGPRAYSKTRGRSQAVRQGTLTPSCAGSSPAVPASPEGPHAAPSPPGGEAPAGRELPPLLQGARPSPRAVPAFAGDERTGDGRAEPVQRSRAQCPPPGSADLVGRSRRIEAERDPPEGRDLGSGIPSNDDPVAQSAEQLPFKQWVRGSNPRRVTKENPL